MQAALTLVFFFYNKEPMLQALLIVMTKLPVRNRYRETDSRVKRLLEI